MHQGLNLIICPTTILCGSILYRLLPEFLGVPNLLHDTSDLYYQISQQTLK